MSSTNEKVPHLTTALSGPLQKLEQHFLTHQVKIESWLREQWKVTPPPFYASVDLRNAGFKLAPVDTNLYPGGFNNLNPDFMPLAIQAVQATVEQICPDVSEILLIPESHTRNMPYFDNIAMLRDILERAGFKVHIGSLLEQLTEAKTITTPSGASVTLEPLVREGDRIKVSGKSPNLILLNNDFAEGVPKLLKGIEQTAKPPFELGWATRLKSVHFGHYQDISHEFAKEMGLDSWVLAPLFRFCGSVDFQTHEGEDCLIKHTDTLLKAIQAKYDEYGVEQEPFVVIKSDYGTYGMSVLMVKTIDELKQLNRKQRAKMAAAKGGASVTKIIIQEGVYTFETLGEKESVAEPVVYMIGRQVIGGFYRVHEGRGKDENLNAPGMNFEPLAFAEPCNNPCGPDEGVNRFYAYGVVARLALLAAARELKEVLSKTP